MKAVILTDLEGPSGVNGRSDGIGNTMPNRTTAEQALVNEVNACCDGLVAAGADEILVFDGHGGSSSIDLFKLHPKATLLQVGQWSPVVYFDGTYDAFIQLGAHAMQSSGGYMCHTFNSHGIAEMRFNGEPIGEVGMTSLIAAYFHVPTILVSGDEAGCREAKAFLGANVATVPTKFGVNRYTAINYSPEKVYDTLRKTAESAMRNHRNMPCPKLPAHCELQVRMMCPNQALAAEMIGIERLDEVTLRYSGDDLIDIWAQYIGWAPGVHRRKFGVTPEWRHPYTICSENQKS